MSPHPPSRVDGEVVLHNNITCIKHKQGLCIVKRRCTVFMLKFLDCNFALKTQEWQGREEQRVQSVRLYGRMSAAHMVTHSARLTLKNHISLHGRCASYSAAKIKPDLMGPYVSMTQCTIFCLFCLWTHLMWMGTNGGGVSGCVLVTGGLYLHLVSI